jgi:hypothetical protein
VWITLAFVNLVAVQVQRDVVGEGHHRQRGGGLRLDRHLVPHHVQDVVDAEALADVLLGDDDRAGGRERRVAAGVVHVPMRVDHEAHRLLRQRAQRHLQLGRHRLDLVVDDEEAVVTDGRGDVAAGEAVGPLDHRDAADDRRRLERDLGGIPHLRARRDGDEREGKGSNQAPACLHARQLASAARRAARMTLRDRLARAAH